VIKKIQHKPDKNTIDPASTLTKKTNAARLPNMTAKIDKINTNQDADNGNHSVPGLIKESKDLQYGMIDKELEDGPEAKTMITETIVGGIKNEETTVDSILGKNFILCADDSGLTVLPKAMKATCQTTLRKCRN
jgi:hypothetical protein